MEQGGPRVRGSGAPAGCSHTIHGLSALFTQAAPHRASLARVKYSLSIFLKYTFVERITVYVCYFEKNEV